MLEQVLVYVVTTDSADQYIFVYSKEPTKEEFAKRLAEELGDEAEYVSGVREYWETVDAR